MSLFLKEKDLLPLNSSQPPFTFRTKVIISKPPKQALCIKFCLSFFLFLSVLSKYENQITIFTDYLEEFPDTDELVWILGKQHLLKTGKVW